MSGISLLLVVVGIGEVYLADRGGRMTMLGAPE